MAKNSILEKFKKLSGNEYSFLLSNDDNPYTVKQTVNTGCYLLNAALYNGDIFGGLPLGKRIIFSGESGVAKSLLCVYVLKSFMDKYPDANVIFFESEGSSILEQAESVKLNKNNVLILPVNTIQDFKVQSTRILSQIKEEQKKGNKDQYIFVLDSLGLLGSNKERNDAIAGEDKKDMTKAADIRGAFRNITLDLSLTNTPFLISNHVYDSLNAYQPKTQSGGKAVTYCGDQIFLITKAKEKDGDIRCGSTLSLKLVKSRFQKEDTVYKLLLLYNKGLWKYSGLFELALKYGIFKKEGNSYIVSNDGIKVTKKEIYKNADTYYTEDILNKLNMSLMADVGFGITQDINIENFSDEEEDDE
jgi:hypothetical protein